jgi:excisionase family DNA binding protein
MLVVPLEDMDVRPTDGSGGERQTAAAPSGQAGATEVARGHAQLRAALERELAAAPDAFAPPVEAWARQLGLQETALLTTDEAAPLLRICERSVRQGIKEGRIPHVRLGRRLFIPVPMLLAMLLEGGDAHG